MCNYSLDGVQSHDTGPDMIPCMDIYYVLDFNLRVVLCILEGISQLVLDKPYLQHDRVGTHSLLGIVDLYIIIEFTSILNFHSGRYFYISPLHS